MTIILTCLYCTDCILVIEGRKAQILQKVLMDMGLYGHIDFTGIRKLNKKVAELWSNDKISIFLHKHDSDINISIA